jgi:hypothetical protein
MIQRNSLFCLICLIGYLIIVFNYIPVIWNGDTLHISLFPKGTASDIYLEFIDYKRLYLYLILWAVICFLLYHIVKGFVQKKSKIN